jgi:large subunit ribosomal protein L22
MVMAPIRKQRGPNMAQSLNQDRSALAQGALIRSSARKLNLVAEQIRGMHVTRALDVLANSKRRIAKEVHKILMSAIANAENNHNLDVDRLSVSEACVGRAFVMKRFHARGRSRSGKIWKEFSKLRLVVTEKEGA